jgi:hypothetical protein
VLSFKGPNILPKGQPVTLTFALRNVGERPTEYCLTDNGVSVRIRDATQGLRVLIMHGEVTDVGCWRPDRLLPNEERLYQEQVNIPQDVPCAAALIAVLRVHWRPADWEIAHSRGDADIRMQATDVQLCEETK